MSSQARGALELSPEENFDVLQQAANWFSVLHATDVHEEDIARWRDWLTERPAHQKAWARVEAISGKFISLPTQNKSGARQLLDVVAQRQATRRRVLGVLIASGAAGLGALGLARVTPWQAWVAEHRTGTGEQREVRLVDGASIWLNTTTSIDVHYSATLRQVVLRSGEILIQTATDSVVPSRPFVVDTNQGRLRALGTYFNVQQLDDASMLAVFEGSVEIQPRELSTDRQIVRAGEQVRFTAQAIAAPSQAELRRQSWARGQLIAENMRLGDFLLELSRYRHGYLGCDPKVANIRIVGTYSLANTDRVLSALEATLPVRVQSTLPWWTVVRPR